MISEQIIESLGRKNEAAFAQAMGDLRSTIPTLTEDEVAREAAALAGALDRFPIGIGSYVAPMIGGMCDYGARPAEVLDALVDGALRVLANLEPFKQLCAQAGIKCPVPGDEEAFQTTMQALIQADAVRLAPNEIAGFAEAWFAGDGWLQPVLYLCQRKEVRQNLPRRAELSQQIAQALQDLGSAQWLHGLLHVLDDEPLIVLDRASGQGWRCTISGIGDNFQLHTLLAGALAEQVGTTRPTAAELAAAGTGNPQPEGGLTGRFNLVAADGSWIWNEGRPADIPFHHGVRVVVLDPPPYQRGWNAGRAYPLMPPALTVDGPLTPDEAAHWLSGVQPSANR